MHKTMSGKMWIVAAAVVVGGCAAPRPVLYPNEHYNQVGDATAQRDIDDCIEKANAYVSSGGASAQKAKHVATNTAVGGGTGAAIGAVGGAVTGNAGEGAAVGAATGATAGLLSGLWGASQGSAPDPVFANFVDHCLRDRGYDPIGWK